VSLFPPAWFASGVVTAESAADFERWAAREPHWSTRHWRWAAFRDWVEEREPLTAEQCRAVYQLGETEAEADANLGTAIMSHAVLQRACPPDVRDTAVRSLLPALRHLFAARRGRRDL
jgi:hypothetical protein